MKIVVGDNVLHTGDTQSHKPCHHLDQQMQVQVQSSYLKGKGKKIVRYLFHSIETGEQSLQKRHMK